MSDYERNEAFKILSDTNDNWLSGQISASVEANSPEFIQKAKSAKDAAQSQVDSAQVSLERDVKDYFSGSSLPKLATDNASVSVSASTEELPYALPKEKMNIFGVIVMGSFIYWIFSKKRRK